MDFYIVKLFYNGLYNVKYFYITLYDIKYFYITLYNVKYFYITLYNVFPRRRDAGNPTTRCGVHSMGVAQWIVLGYRAGSDLRLMWLKHAPALYGQI